MWSRMVAMTVSCSSFRFLANAFLSSSVSISLSSVTTTMLAVATSLPVTCCFASGSSSNNCSLKWRISSSLTYSVSLSNSNASASRREVLISSPLFTNTGNQSVGSKALASPHWIMLVLPVHPVLQKGHTQESGKLSLVLCS